jgi:excinuclease ABC subunit C
MAIKNKRIERSESLLHKVDLLPRTPGVYIFRDDSGVIVYIGKAKVLANRVRSYFVDSYDDGRGQIHQLVRSIADMEYIATRTETEALVLEATLVRKHSPRYNIKLKDSTKYPYLKITNEDFPRLEYTRIVDKKTGRYYGPYTDVKAARRTQETLHRLFPIRTCLPRLPSPAITRVCLQYEIKRCAGPCVNLQSKEDYTAIIDQAERFLKGQVSSVVNELQELMNEASTHLDFERAAEIRDRLEDIKSITQRQTVDDPNGNDRDVMAIARDDTEAVAVVLEVREGRVIGRKDHSLTVGLDESSEAILSAFIRQYYLDALVIPRIVSTFVKPTDATNLNIWLGERRGGSVSVQVPQRGDKVRLVGIAEKNAEMLLTERRIRRERQRDRIPHSIQALQRDLRMKEPPRRIACLDISHLQGTEMVGSMVVFQDAKPLKNAYRKYNIKSVGGTIGSSDDFAAMEEVIQRQFRRIGEEDDELAPDLLIVDGGKGQLSSAVEALQRAGFPQQPVIGLAKRLEEVFVPGVSAAQNIPRTSSGLKLLQQLRDEAHRFAITHHRQRRGKSVSASALDGMPGVGPVRKKALLRQFKSVAGIIAATADEIATVDGIGPATAKAILAALTPDAQQ